MGRSDRRAPLTELDRCGVRPVVRSTGGRRRHPERERAERDGTVATFRDNGLDEYADRRDLPAERGTSELSPFLKYGVIHPRQLLAETDARNPSHKTFQSELAWRDFYADVLYQKTRTAWNNLDERFDKIDLDTGKEGQEKFERWKNGTTGFPIVDAGMRQLTSTGWMHNRVRMIVASFLVKDLHLPSKKTLLINKHDVNLCII